MFIGEHEHSLDDKGRLAMPVRFRASFAEGVVVTRGLDGCLFVYTRTEWQKLAEKLINLPLSQGDARKFARLMLAGAFDADLDKQGRVNIPGYLREFAHLGAHVIVAGLYNRLEIWDKHAWKKQQAEAEGRSDEIAEHLVDFGV